MLNISMLCGGMLLIVWLLQVSLFGMCRCYLELVFISCSVLIQLVIMLFIGNLVGWLCWQELLNMVLLIRVLWQWVCMVFLWEGLVFLLVFSILNCRFEGSMVMFLCLVFLVRQVWFLLVVVLVLVWVLVCMCLWIIWKLVDSVLLEIWLLIFVNVLDRLVRIVFRVMFGIGFLCSWLFS